MGVYVYTLRAKKANVRIGNETVKANLLAFAYKPYYGGEQPAQFDRQLTRAENFWDKRETPQFVIVGDKIENGCEVRGEWPTGLAVCYDTPDYPGEHVGYLKKVGRTWTVVSTENECYRNWQEAEGF